MKRLLVWITAPLWVPVIIGMVLWVSYCDAKDQAREDADGEGGE